MALQPARLRRPPRERSRWLERKVERPPAHWLLLCMFVGTLFALLLAEGLTVHGAGRSGTPPPPTAHRVRALESNAALWVAGPNGALVPHQEPIGKRIALTFDDGPDPTWTPKIAE